MGVPGVCAQLSLKPLGAGEPASAGERRMGRELLGYSAAWVEILQASVAAPHPSSCSPVRVLHIEPLPVSSVAAPRDDSLCLSCTPVRCAGRCR